MRFSEAYAKSQLGCSLSFCEDSIREILSRVSPGYFDICIDDFPYHHVVELEKAIGQDDIDRLVAMGCECLSYGNAAKAGTGEGASAVVVRF